MKITRLAFLIGILLTSLTFRAQEDTESAEEIIQTSFSVPEIPALDFISADPENISRPSTAKELATSLYSAIDENGNIKQGLAFEIKPVYLIGNEIDLNDYQNNRFKYILHNTQVSLATLATSGDSTSTDLSWGLRIVLLDKSDPMANSKFTQDVGQVFLDCVPKTPDSKGDDEACLAKKLKEIQDEFIENNWNAAWLTLAYAGGTRLDGSQITQGEIIGHKIWLAGGYPLGKWGLISGQTSWSRQLKEETQLYFEEFELGARLTFKVVKPTINFFSEINYTPLLNKEDFNNVSDVKTDETFGWSAGFEFFITKGLWATAGIGQEAERIVGSDNIQVLSGLRLGISDKQRIK